MVETLMCIRLRVVVAVLMCAVGARGYAADGATPASGSGIEVESVVLRLFEEAEVPAQEAGVVVNVAVREGQRVKQGELLAQLDDQVPRLAADAAKAKYDITHEKATNDVKIRYAQKALDVS
jgi:multidrug efflux pump subunit AcrA (membrane-fusion protein)